MSYVFVPLTDELLYEYPELITGPVIPYVAGKTCYHWLSVEINPQESTPLRQFSQTWQRPVGLPIAEKAVRGAAHSF